MVVRLSVQCVAMPTPNRACCSGWPSRNGFSNYPSLTKIRLVRHGAGGRCGGGVSPAWPGLRSVRFLEGVELGLGDGQYAGRRRLVVVRRHLALKFLVRELRSVLELRAPGDEERVRDVHQVVAARFRRARPQGVLPMVADRLETDVFDGQSDHAHLRSISEGRGCLRPSTR